MAEQGLGKNLVAETNPQSRERDRRERERAREREELP